jgi:phosphoadenosine phosphosulfate reductase
LKPIFEQERQFLYNKTGILLPEDCWRNSHKIYLDCTCKIPLYTFKIKNKNIIIAKDNTSKFTNYKQKKINELIKINKQTLNSIELNSIKKTIDYVLKHLDYKYVINHSGGKDSTVMYNVWLQALDIIKTYNPEIYNNIQWEINFSNTSNETADTYLYVKSLPGKLHILNPAIGFYQWIVKVKNYFIPSAMVRNCCSTYKEGQVNKYYDKKERITMVLGMRKYESTKRAKYDYVMDSNYIKNVLNKKSNLPELWIRFNPLGEWHDEEIWLYILKENLQYNKQYQKARYET